MENVLKVKLVKNFQQVEFEMIIDSEDNDALLKRAIDLVNDIGGQITQEIGVTNVKTPVNKQDNPASEKQLNLMKKFGAWDPCKKYTYKEANMIIKNCIAYANGEFDKLQ